MQIYGIIVTEPKGAVTISKSFPKPEITLDRIYSEFADEGYCKAFLLDARFEKTSSAHSEAARNAVRSRHVTCCAASPATYHGNEKIHTALYIAEYCYKFNRRRLGNSAYLRLLAALVQLF